MTRPAALALALALAACIERPEQTKTRTVDVDRTKLSDVLLTAAPQPAYPVNAEWAEKVELVGIDVSPDPLPRGKTATVTGYFRVNAPVGDDWKIFVHIEDPAKTMTRIIVDHYPAGDRLRTNAWQKGDVVKDTFTFTVPQDAPDRLEIWTGFFIENDRLDVSSAGRGTNDGQNRVRVATPSVR